MKNCGFIHMFFWTCCIVKKSNFYKRQKFKLMEVQKLFWKIFFVFYKNLKFHCNTPAEGEDMEIVMGFFLLYFMFTWLRKFATAW